VNILITAANSAQAHQLKNKLNTGNVILGDYHDLPAFMLAAGNMIRLPDPRSAAYAHQMLTLCLDNAITKIYVKDKEEELLLTEAGQLFKEYGIELLITSDEV
jgi:hypothetical protein